MKSIYKLMMLPLMVLPLIFASCDTDDGSNPKLDLSHVKTILTTWSTRKAYGLHAHSPTMVGACLM